MTGRFSILLAAAVAVMYPRVVSAEGDVDFSGIVRAGYQVREHVGPEAEAEVKLKTEPREGTRGVVKLEARHYRDHVLLERAYVEHLVLPGLDLRLGLDQKRLGLEYQQDTEERLTARRSLLYQKMEVLGLVGQQLQVRAATKPAEDVFLDVAAGVSGSRDANVVLHAAHTPGSLGYGTWVLLQRERVDKGYFFVWAQAVSGWYVSGQNRLVLELIGGIDPDRTELERLLGDGRRVFFGGPKLELARRLPLPWGLVVEPLVQASVMWNDLADARSDTIQVVAGANVLVWGFLLALEGSYVAEREQNAPGAHRNHRPDLLVEVRYVF